MEYGWQLGFLDPVGVMILDFLPSFYEVFLTACLS